MGAVGIAYAKGRPTALKVRSGRQAGRVTGRAFSSEGWIRSSGERVAVIKERRYPSPMVVPVSPKARAGADLRQRLDMIRSLNDEDLGFEGPSSEAFSILDELIRGALDRAKDPSRLHVHPDEHGVLDLILDGDEVTVMASTDGTESVQVRRVTSTWPVRREAVKGSAAALDLMFSAAFVGA